MNKGITLNLKETKLSLTWQNYDDRMLMHHATYWAPHWNG